MEAQETARRAVEKRLSENQPGRIFTCVGMTEEFTVATVDVFDPATDDDYTISCKIVWLDQKRDCVKRLSWKSPE